MATMTLHSASQAAFADLPLLQEGVVVEAPHTWFQLELAEASGHVDLLTVYEFLHHLNARLQWQVNVWELSQRARPCALEVPVVYARLCGFPAFLLWAGSGERGRQGSKAKGTPWWSWTQDLDAGGGRGEKRKVEEASALPQDDPAVDLDEDVGDESVDEPLETPFLERVLDQARLR